MTNQILKAFLLLLCLFVNWNSFVTVVTPILHFMIIIIGLSGKGTTKSSYYCLNFPGLIARCRYWSLLLVRLSLVFNYSAFLIDMTFRLLLVLDFISSWFERYHTFHWKLIIFQRFFWQVLLLLLAFWTIEYGSKLWVCFVRCIYYRLALIFCLIRFFLRLKLYLLLWLWLLPRR